MTKPTSPIDKKKWKEGLKKQQKESTDRKDEGGMFKSIYKSTLSKDKMYQASEDEHEINIIPYIAGKNNPHAKEGEPVYGLEIWVHRQIGASNDNYVCLDKNYGQDCPICNHRAKLLMEECEDEKLVKSLAPSKRLIYNIVCLDSPKEIKKGVQIFEVSQYLFEKPLMEAATLPKGGGVILFSDPDEGQKVYFKKSGKGLKLEFQSFKFFDRKEEEEMVTDEILAAAFCIENYISIPTEDEIKRALHTESVDEKPVNKKKPVEDDIKDEADEVNAEEEENKEEVAEEIVEGECPVGVTFGADFDEYENCNDCPVRDACQAKKEELMNPPEEKPVKPTKKKKEEAPPEEKKKVFTECPLGAEFGKEWEEYENCKDCEANEDCKAKKEELDNPPPEKKEKPVMKKKEPENKKPGIRKRPGK